MTTLNDLHGKVPPPPVHVVALGFNGPWEVQTMKVKLATCRDRNVADFIAALWNLMPPVEEVKSPAERVADIIEEHGRPTYADLAEGYVENVAAIRRAGLKKQRRRKAVKSVQVMP